MKKKVMVMVMAAAMAAAMTACGGSKSATADTTAAAADTTAASDDVSADVQKIVDRGVLKVGCKSDVPNFSLQNTATGEYEGFEDDLAYNIAGEIFGCTPEEAKDKKLVEFQGVTAKTRGPLLE